MAIIQISKLQQRSGNLVDLPQLDNAQFGWAQDAKKLFIGSPDPENVEVLTAYSSISFSQIDGSGGANISSSDLQMGQTLAYNPVIGAWTNYDGNLLAGSGKLNLGTAANLKITGGSIGYVLETDGTGNLSWTPKGSVQANIYALSNTNPIVMTVANTVPYTNGTLITISGVSGTNANTIVNSHNFYIKVANTYSTTGNVFLYADSSLTIGANGFYLTATPNTGVATYSISGGGGGGSGYAGGANTSIQFNNSGTFDGSANLTFDFANSVLNVTGTTTSNTVTSTGIVTGNRLVSTVSTGTAPLVVTSTTQVANLYSTLAATVTTNAQPNITSVGTLSSVVVSGNATAGNLVTGGIVSATGNIISSGNIYANSGTVGGSLLTGTLTSSAQPNVTSVGTLTALTVTGNTVSGNVYANSGTVGASLLTGTLTTSDQPNVTTVGTLSSLAVSGNAIAGNVYSNTGTIGALYITGTLTTSSQTNITTVGTLSALTVSGNTSAGNLNTGGIVSATGNIISSGNIYANTGTIGGSLVKGTLTTAAQPNVTSVGTLTSLNSSGTVTAPAFTANTGVFTGNGSALNSLTGANVTGTVANATFATSAGSATSATTAGTVTTAAQANITSVGTLTSLGVSGNITAANITANTGIFSGNGIGLTALAGANVTGTVANATFATSAGSATTAGTVTTAAQPNITSVGTLSAVSITGNAIAGNVYANAGTIGASLLTGTLTTAAQPNITSVGTLSSVTVSGNLTSGNANLGNLARASFFQGDGSLLTNLSISAGNTIQNGNSNVTVTANSNVTVSITGTSNVVVFSTAGAGVNGTVTASRIISNVATGTAPFTVTSTTLVPNLFVANATFASSAGSATTATSATTAGTVTTAAQPNITSVGTLSSLSVTGSVSAGSVGVGVGAVTLGTLTTGANTTAGTIIGNWSLSAGSRLTATYADLAEYYASDEPYEPGTVVEFGGTEEVTIATDSTSRVAGVISTDPAYAMNAKCPGLHPVAIALQGRVPCKVRGTIRKGDMMVSAGGGFARPSAFPIMGSVIGKALENFDGVEGIIEVAVGRL